MKERWQMGDLVDLEFFLAQDKTVEEEAGPESLASRDRGIYLGQIEPVLRTENRDPDQAGPFIIKKWLEQRRRMEGESNGKNRLLPGRIFDQAYSLLLLLLGTAGFITGGVLASSFLAYRGTEPLNVSLYLWLFVFLQIALVLATGVLLLSKGKGPFVHQSPLLSFVGTLIEKTVLMLKNKAREGLSAKRRDSLATALGVVKGRSSFFSCLFPWPLFILSQFFGCAFNLGILAATMLRVATSDLAFGWQSTLRLGPEAVEKIVGLIALPWSWFVPVPLAHPTLSQIEGSHIVLKDGVANLATPDLVSWWPFLCLAVFFYGLLPRMALLTGGRVLRDKKLAGLKFETAPFSRLLFRLKTPVIETGGENDQPPEHETVEDEKPDTVPATPPSPTGEKEVALLVPEEIIEDFLQRVPEKEILNRTGAGAITPVAVALDMDMDREALETGLNGDARIVLVQEAWQPPIRQTLLFISELKEMAGPHNEIHILLIGKTSGETALTAPEKEHETIWNNKIKALGDPGITTERFA